MAQQLVEGPVSVTGCWTQFQLPEESGKLSLCEWYVIRITIQQRFLDCYITRSELAKHVASQFPGRFILIENVFHTGDRINVKNPIHRSTKHGTMGAGYTRARWKVLGLANNRCNTGDKWPGWDPERNWCHRNTGVKPFWSQSMAPWTPVAAYEQGEKFSVYNR